LGISHAGTTAGAGGAVPGLGQVKADNARRNRVPGSMAWSRASQAQAAGECRGGAPRGERAAISARPCLASTANGWCACRRSASPRFFWGGLCGRFLQNSGAAASRERDCFFTSPVPGEVASEATRVRVLSRESQPGGEAPSPPPSPRKRGEGDGSFVGNLLRLYSFCWRKPAMAINGRRNKPFGPGGSTRRLHQSRRTDDRRRTTDNGFA